MVDSGRRRSIGVAACPPRSSRAETTAGGETSGRVSRSGKSPQLSIMVKHKSAYTEFFSLELLNLQRSASECVP